MARTSTLIFTASILSILSVSSKCEALDAPTRSASYSQQEDKAQKTYKRYRELAEKGNKAGFTGLYRIANNDIEYTATYSEFATAELGVLLEKQTGVWLRTFSSLKGFRWQGITEFPKEGDEIAYLNGLIEKIQAFRGSPAEMRFANRIIRVLDQQRDRYKSAGPT